MSKVTYTSPSQTYAYSNAAYSASTDAWGVGSLVDGVDYSTSLTFDPTSSPVAAAFSWAFPQDVGGVYAYPHIDFEAQSANLSTAQSGNIGSLSANYSVNLTNTAESTVAFDIWFNSQPNGSWTTTSDELLIEVAPTSAGTPNTPFVLSGSGFTDASVYVSNQSEAGANWKFIDVKLPSDMMSGTISISDIIKGLIWDGVLTGQEYLTSLQFGSEVHGGTGSLQINSLAYNWTANPTSVVSAGNTFSIATPGGNDVVGNGGVDTVVYAGSHSSYQIKSSGSEILVTENNNISTLDELQGITFIQFSDGTYNTATGSFTAAGSVVMAPTVTETLAHDTGSSSTDKITSNDTLSGSADPNAVLHFTVDGAAIASTATANASGVWTFTPGGLADGSHTVIASETNAAGNTGSTSLTFTLDTQPPVVAINNLYLSNGAATVTGTASEANDKISVYDGSTLLGTTTTGSNGTWSFTTGGLSNAVHTYTVTETDTAGNVGDSNEAVLGSTGANALVATSSNAIIMGDGGNDTFTSGGGSDIMIAGTSGRDTFIFKAIANSTPASPDVLVNFNHVNDTIEFTAISGINTSHGSALFQGQLGGAGTLNAHSVGYIEVSGNTEVFVNTTNSAETVTASDAHTANMEVILAGIHLGLTSSNFHLV